jgi:hypothetical protein
VDRRGARTFTDDEQAMAGDPPDSVSIEPPSDLPTRPRCNKITVLPPTSWAEGAADLLERALYLRSMSSEDAAPVEAAITDHLNHSMRSARLDDEITLGPDSPSDNITVHWTCGWCGDTLRPYDGAWVGDIAGDYCPEGKAVGSTGTSPHLPIKSQSILDTDHI